MAYGNGSSRDDLKRMADLGHVSVTQDMSELHWKCRVTVKSMAEAIWPDHISQRLPSGKELDQILLRVQSQASKDGVNNVWAEKMRLLAKSAVVEQWRRRQKTLFGRFKNISARSDSPTKDGVFPLKNLPHIWSERLSEQDVTQIQGVADILDFQKTLKLFGNLREDGRAYGLTPVQIEALQVLSDRVSKRFGCPEWREDARFQLHLDYRCVKGVKPRLDLILKELNNTLQGGVSNPVSFQISSHQPRGAGIPIKARFPKAVVERFDGQAYADRQTVKSILLELGSDTAQVKAVILRKPDAPDISSLTIVVAEDFGLINTSTLVVARSKSGISPAHVQFARSNPGKTATKDFLESHISGDDVEILERVQINGRGFLDRVKDQASKIDTLRSEIDRNYNRLQRIKHEINRILGKDLSETVQSDLEQVVLSNTEQDRYIRMHGRFFRLLCGIDKLKARRRSIYRAIDGLKRSWLGWVSTIKANLAEKYNAVAVSEKLSILATEKSNPGYKGRTFNKMLNNGSKGQYTRRANEKLDWRGIARIALPSFYSSITDWRTGRIDKHQRKGAVFRAMDGMEWDADLHASELLARWLFLKPKPVSP